MSIKKNVLFPVICTFALMSSAFAWQQVKTELRIEADSSGSVDVNVNENSKVHTFAFNKVELADLNKLESSLADLSPDVREKVIAAIKNINLDAKGVFLASNDGQFEVLTDDLGGEKHEIIVVHSGEGNVIDINSVGDKITKKIIKKIHEKKELHPHKEFHFAFTEKGGSAEHIVNVVEKLLTDAKLSPEQLDKLQALLDRKR